MGYSKNQGGRVGLEPMKLKERWYGRRKKLLVPACLNVDSRIKSNVASIFLIRKDRDYYLPRHTYCDTKLCHPRLN